MRPKHNYTDIRGRAFFGRRNGTQQGPKAEKTSVWLKFTERIKE